MAERARRARTASSSRVERAGPDRPANEVTHFRMPSRRDAIAPAVERVLLAVEGAQLNREQLDNLAVAVAEALSNAAVHGNGLTSGKTVKVGVAVVPKRCATIEVTDGGTGFDQDKVSDPTDPERVLVPGGRGVFLMRRLVDRVEYNTAGNSVRLVMESLPDADAAPERGN